MKKEVNEYYAKYFKDWLFLYHIDCKTVIEIIKQKSETKISEIISLSYNKINIYL